MWCAETSQSSEPSGRRSSRLAADARKPDLAPTARRGLAYGVFSAAYGLAWLVGATLIGALYARSLPEVELLAVLTQALALVVFVPLLRSGKGARPAA